MIYFTLYGILIIHGLIHLIGFAEAFQLMPIAQFTRHVSRLAGILWLGGSLFFIGVLILAVLQISVVWIALLAAITISQGLIIGYWHDAKYGSIPNAILLIIALFNLGS